MKPPDWDRIEEIYHEALAMPQSERSAFVAKACGNDPVCMHEVNALLETDDSLEGFLETPIVELHPFSADNLVGTMIDDRYRIKEKLGHGGMGELYLAQEKRPNGGVVVLKFLSQDLLDDPSALTRFKKEAEALSRIHHTGVVEVLDVGELADGRPYIVMQYIDGEMLRSLIRSEGMNLERTASILKQIGDALDHVHQKGIFHRDLKPENIMLKRGTDSVVIVDFGIAKVTNSLVAPSTAHGVSPGTLVYMSPEQLRGERVTAATDIYSMALVAYEMVTGRRPFNPTSQSQLLDMQRGGVRAKPCDLRPNLPPLAQDVILRSLLFKVRDRYKSAGEFGNDLARALTTEALPTPWGKKRLAAIGALIILISTAALIATYTINGNGNGRINGNGHNRSFNYWLTVQRMHDGQPYREPFQSHGEDEIFENGDRFRLRVLSPVPAYVYVINEGPPEPGSSDTNFRMIFPNVATNNGSATLGANQTVESEWFTFRGPPGDENFWLVWSVTPVTQLESAKTEAFKHPEGGLTGQNLVSVKEFLRVKASEVKVTVYNYNANNTAVARGPSDMLVTLAQFKHR
jgi:Kae1-associated kinase Bud32